MGTKSHSYFIWCRCGLLLDMRVMVPWWWMRSELNGDTFGCINFKESLVGGPPWFRDLEISLNSFGNDISLPFSLHAFILLIFSIFWFFMIIMLNAMIIRFMVYICSIWDTPIFIWIIILCSHFSLVIVYIITLKHAHLP